MVGLPPERTASVQYRTGNKDRILLYLDFRDYVKHVTYVYLCHHMVGVDLISTHVSGTVE